MMDLIYRNREVRRWLGLFGAVLVIGVVAPAVADEADEFAPVATLIDIVETDFPGRILMIELAQAPAAKAPARYDVKLLTDDGNVLRLHYDARTLELAAVEGRGDVAASKDAGEIEDENETEDETDRADDDDDEDDRDRDGAGDKSGRGSADDDGKDDSDDGKSGNSGSGSSGSGSSGSGGGSDDGPDHD